MRARRAGCPECLASPALTGQHTSLTCAVIVRQLALYASQAATALFIYSEFIIWSRNCTRLRAALRPGRGTAEFTAYLDSYRAPSQELLATSLLVAEESLDRGDDLDEAVAVAGLLKGFAPQVLGGCYRGDIDAATIILSWVPRLIFLIS